MRFLIAATSLFLVASFVAGCGGSRHLTGAGERTAIRAAQRENTNLLIFPAHSGTISCQIPPSVHSGGYSGHCTTKVVTHRDGTRIDFIQRATVNGHAQTGDWIYYLDQHNRFVHFHPSGWLPQDQP
jgi:hypothetical protein